MKMMTKLVLKACVGLIAIAVTSMANATTFSFNGTNLGIAEDSAYESINTSLDGIGLTITALTIANDGSGDISQTFDVIGQGIGVYLRADTSGPGGSLGVRSFVSLSGGSSDGTNLDGGDGTNPNDLDEGLLFSFDRLVSLDYINFDSFSNSSGDDFNLTVDGVSVLVDFNANDSDSRVSNVSGQFDEYRFNSIVGSEFLFWADGNSDSFRIDTLEVSAVPVPAAAWLFGSALLGMFGFSRRKKA